MLNVNGVVSGNMLTIWICSKSLPCLQIYILLHHLVPNAWKWSYWIGQVSGDVRVIFYQKMIGGRLFYACFNTAFIKNSLLQVCLWFPFLICFLNLRRQRKEENFLSFMKDTKVKDFLHLQNLVAFYLFQFTIRDLDKVGKAGRSICGPAFCVELLFGPANPKHSMTSSDEFDTEI